MGRAVRPHLSCHNSSSLCGPSGAIISTGTRARRRMFSPPVGVKEDAPAQTTETDTPTHGYENLNVSGGLQMFNSTAFG